MSTAAVMLVKDEADIIEPILFHLLENVAHVYVQDNASTDGTRELLSVFSPASVTVIDDPIIGYWQADKTTKLAIRAYEDGHKWVIPCDADEWWYATDGRPIERFLAGLSPDAQLVTADIYNHVPTSHDDADERNPVLRIGWRFEERQKLGKVACRLQQGLYIHAGNHDADTPTPPMMRGGGLAIRHYSWRSAEQYVRKIRNGMAAYARTDLDPTLGEHWRMWEGRDDDAIVEHFYRWFHFEHPEDDDDLIYDPAIRSNP